MIWQDWQPVACAIIEQYTTSLVAVSILGYTRIYDWFAFFLETVVYKPFNKS